MKGFLNFIFGQIIMCVGRLKLRLNYFSSGTRICTFMAHTLLWIALAEQESHWFVLGPDGRLPAACLLILYQLFTAAVSRILRYSLGVRIWQISLIFVCFECVKYSSVVHHCSLCTVSGGPPNISHTVLGSSCILRSLQRCVSQGITGGVVCSS